jgi:hypothetical protein
LQHRQKHPEAYTIDFTDRHVANVLNSLKHVPSGQKQKERHQQCHGKSGREIWNDEQKQGTSYPLVVKQPAAVIREGN